MDDTQERARQENAAAEINRGERFAFGDNWRAFLSLLTEERIATAEASLKEFLEVPDLKGKKFLDVGCGSGLFSLAARRLGAQVRSFDFDPASVGCTMELRRRYFPDDRDWIIEQGSALDETWMKSLGQHDIVYSWGVLHHTGNLWKALDLVRCPVTSGGKLFISLYNDQGRASKYWMWIKKTYCRLPGVLKPLILLPVAVRLWGPRIALDTLHGSPLRTVKSYNKLRGMSAWRDVVDWVGGYPFEVSRPDQVFDFFRRQGFSLERLTTCSGEYGCNQFVFTPRSSRPAS
jgi:2-polyprenyl-3-methyl-5-hydroxy-6-metoxy-1,4-benzoquinol methylase